VPSHDDEVLIPLADVQSMVLSTVTALPPVQIPVDDALGCVTAEDVLVAEDVPPFPNTAMDGFAVQAADTAAPPADLEVVGVLAAGAAPSVGIGPGQAIQIMTGAPIPAGADAVAIVEKTETLATAGDGRTPLRVRVGYSVLPGENLRLAGSDLAAGAVAVPAGTVLTPAHLGVLASVGVVTVPAYRRPRVAVMTTGDELVEIGTTPIGGLAPGQIRDSNRHALLATVRRDGFEAVDFGVVRDTREAVSNAIGQALGHCDAVLTTGGVSKGEFDYVKVVLAELVEAAGDDARFEQLSVAIRPAKPFAFALLPRRAAGGPPVPVFGLPGNPVSSLVSYQTIALPVLRVLAGHPPAYPATVAAVAAEPFRRRPDGKLHLNRVQVRWSADGHLEARSAGGQMSHQLSGMAGANALALVPDGDGIAEGDRVQVLVFGEVA
jgi:molybdenum cofactor synthesis domain-containing protein